MPNSCHCPDTYPDWHNRDVDLGGNTAHVIKIPCVFNMPLSYDTYVQRQHHDLDQLELQEQYPGFVLSRIGLFSGQIMRLLIPQHSPSRHVQTLDTPFMVRGYLHLGDVGTVQQSTRELQIQIFDQGHMPRELYLCYLTCPACSERKGGHKILLLRRWNPSSLLASRAKKNG